MAIEWFKKNSRSWCFMRLYALKDVLECNCYSAPQHISTANTSAERMCMSFTFSRSTFIPARLRWCLNVLVAVSDGCCLMPMSVPEIQYRMAINPTERFLLLVLGGKESTKITVHVSLTAVVVARIWFLTLKAVSREYRFIVIFNESFNLIDVVSVLSVSRDVCR